MKKLVRFSFLILLVVSCLLVVPGCLLQTYLPDTATTTSATTTTTLPTTTTTTTTNATTTAPTADAVTTENTQTEQTHTTTLPTTIAGGTTVSPSSASTTTQSTTTFLPTTISKPDATTTKPVARSFPNTLFVGDSRTDGLRLYGKIQGATFFCKQSLTAFNMLSTKLKIDGAETTLSGLLDKKQFESVYVMLGINELYKRPEDIAAKYQEIIDLVRQKQPNAVVVVQATLHVTKNKSDTSAFTNTRINSLNQHLKTLADNQHVFFIDPNPAFDDANGNMHAEYSKDGVHYYGKYYPLWSEFLDKNRIVA